MRDLDPGLTYTREQDQLLRVTNDGLMAYRPTGGQGGTILVPNLATAMPEVSEGGRTLTFTIRRGIRFSTGQPLRPADIKRGIDRSLALESDGSQVLGTISEVEADDAAGTVTVRLRRPDDEILYGLALPYAYAVPADTPTEPTKVPLPATGPYRIAHISPRRQVRLERNPYFKSWSAAARPDGYPDAIVLDVTNDDRVALDAVRQGRADWTAAPAFVQGDRVGGRLAAELRRDHARQLHTAVLTATSWVWMNSEVAPFDRLDVRRAVALAIDRREIVDRHGGPRAARATCRILPASFPGYRDDCPFGQDPDLGRARELVRRSGTQGARVTVWNAKPWYTGSSRVLARSLGLLGYRVRIKSLPPERYFPAIKDEKTRAQIGTTLWLSDYPSPSNFLVGSFSCDERRAPENHGNFCDPVADGLMRRAARLPGDGTTRGQRPLGAGGRADHRSGGRDSALQPDHHRLRVRAPRQPPVPPAVGHAVRSGVGAVTAGRMLSVGERLRGERVGLAGSQAAGRRARRGSPPARRCGSRPRREPTSGRYRIRAAA